jgi:3-oxoacyl-[acyl-carrier-protein] synthase II
MNRIVITGIGIISPYGLGKDIFWKSIQCGESVLSHDISVEGSGCKKAARIRDFGERSFLDSKAVRYLQRAEKLALVSSKLALSDAGLEPSHLQELELGIVIGSTASNLRAVATFDRQVLCGEANYVDPSLVPSGIMNSLTGNVSIKNVTRGFHVPVAAGEASGVQAIQFALTQLEAGRVDAVLAGGVDEICDELYLNYCSKESRPYQKSEDNTALSEGAAILVLEASDSAAKRKARTYAECAGFGFSYVPKCYSDREKSVRSAVRAMEHACWDAEVEPADIDLVFASSNGNTIGDAIEIEALKSFFGNRPVFPPVTCIKAALAESLGASGALQAAAAALAIENSVAPPTIGQNNKISDLGLAAQNFKETEIKHVLIDSFSSDGHMTCLVLSKVGI